MNKLIFSFIFTVFLQFTTQSRTITGVVTDKQNKPLDRATVKIDDKKVLTNASGQFTYTTNSTINSFVVYKWSFQFKKISIDQGKDNYSVALESAVYSKEFAPPLRVVGGMIYNAKDQPVKLQGISIHEANNLKENDFVNWTQNWKINVVRLVMHNHERKDDQWPNYLDAVDKVMEWSKKYQLYVLVDGYHEAGCSGSVNSHWDRVQKVWDKLMPRLKNYDHVIWQIYNEPNGDGGNDWVDWAPKAKVLVDKIRSHKPVVNAVTVPAALWAQRLDLTKASVDRDEIIYSFHPYFGRPKPHNPETWDKTFGYLQKQDIAPVFCSEWAAHNEGGDTANQINTYFRPILRYFKNNDIHFSHWGYFPSWGGMPNLVSNNIGQAEKRTIWGDMLFNYFNGSKWDIIEEPLSVPGKIEAEDYTKFKDLKTESCTDNGGGKSLANVNNGSWSQYSVNSKYDASCKFVIRASSGGSGGKVTLVVDGQKKSSVDITPTGGWGEWKTFSASDVFEITSGNHELKLEYSGGSGLFNVNWFLIEASNEVLPRLHSEKQTFQIIKNGNGLNICVPEKCNMQSIGIFHVDGTLAKRVFVNNGQTVIQTGGLSNGTYIIKIGGNYQFSQKILINK